jgi:hypothetical protein
MLDLDLSVLRSPTRFQSMCLRLARYEFPDGVAVAPSWDGGRDAVILGRATAGDIVIQCKFIQSLTQAKPKIIKSLDALATNGGRTRKWILCLPVDPSGVFLDWLRGELAKRRIKWDLWGRSELLIRLEQHRDVLETFFYPVLSELASYFRTDHLELYKLHLDPECQWSQPDPKTLAYERRGNVRSPDLVFDVIVRNTGTVGLAITGIEVEVFDRRTKMHGLPGDGLLFSQITYRVSIDGGRAGVYFTECEPPLLVKAGEPERFKICIAQTGYAWHGGLRLSLHAGNAERLALPALRVFT